jgi:hypothetical protein
MMSTFQFVAIFCMLLAIFMGEGWGRVPSAVGVVFAIIAVGYVLYRREKPR